MTAERWLQQPDVQQLLHLLVNRLEGAEQRNKPLTRPVKLEERNFPALYLSPFESEREAVWANVERLERTGWIRLILDRYRPGTAAYERSPRVAVVDAAAIRTAAGRPARIRSATELWHEAVEAGLQVSDPVKEVIKRHLVAVPGRSAAEVVERLGLIHSLADAPLLLREVSAQLFWTQSKLLDDRQAMVAAMLGLDDCPFPEMPVQLLVALPAQQITGVLFIENQTTFERASRDTGGRYAGLVLAFSSGFKASARRLRRPDGVSVYLAAHADQAPERRDMFMAWLFGTLDLPCWFWGDLDHAGMGILAAMRSSFPVLRAWPSGYETMVKLLEAGAGHLPEQARKQGQQAVARTGCDYADQVLLPALAEYGKFVDQEGVG